MKLSKQLEGITDLVHTVRDVKVMLDFDIAATYGVETRVLNQAVKRNAGRFPKDFMFQLSKKEWENLTSQNVIPSGHGGRRTLPYAFTEHGAVMLASILNSPRAIAASVEIVRVFVRLRDIVTTNDKLARKLAELETKYDSQFNEVFRALKNVIHVETTGPVLKRGRKE